MQQPSATTRPRLTPNELRRRLYDVDAQVRQGVEDGSIREVMRRIGPSLNPLLAYQNGSVEEKAAIPRSLFLYKFLRAWNKPEQRKAPDFVSRQTEAIQLFDAAEQIPKLAPSPAPDGPPSRRSPEPAVTSKPGRNQRPPLPPPPPQPPRIGPPVHSKKVEEVHRTFRSIAKDSDEEGIGATSHSQYRRHQPEPEPEITPPPPTRSKLKNTNPAVQYRRHQPEPEREITPPPPTRSKPKDPNHTFQYRRLQTEPEPEPEITPPPPTRSKPKNPNPGFQYRRLEPEPEPETTPPPPTRSKPKDPTPASPPRSLSPQPSRDKGKTKAPPRDPTPASPPRSLSPQPSRNKGKAKARPRPPIRSKPQDPAPSPPRQPAKRRAESEPESEPEPEQPKSKYHHPPCPNCVRGNRDCLRSPNNGACRGCRTSKIACIYSTRGKRKFDDDGEEEESEELVVRTKKKKGSRKPAAEPAVQVKRGPPRAHPHSKVAKASKKKKPRVEEVVVDEEMEDDDVDEEMVERRPRRPAESTVYVKREPSRSRPAKVTKRKVTAEEDMEDGSQEEDEDVDEDMGQDEVEEVDEQMDEVREAPRPSLRPRSARQNFKDIEKRFEKLEARVAGLAKDSRSSMLLDQRMIGLEDKVGQVSGLLEHFLGQIRIDDGLRLVPENRLIGHSPLPDVVDTPTASIMDLDVAALSETEPEFLTIPSPVISSPAAGSATTPSDLPEDDRMGLGGPSHVSRRVSPEPNRPEAELPMTPPPPAAPLIPVILQQTQEVRPGTNTLEPGEIPDQVPPPRPRSRARSRTPLGLQPIAASSRLEPPTTRSRSRSKTPV